MNLNPEKIDALLKKAFKKEESGAVLGVVKDGQLAYKNAWGMASLENPLPLTASVRLQRGLAAKQFVAYAALSLQQQRKLSMEDEVKKYVPGLPNYGKPIKLRHLLWHSSGLRCYTTLLGLASVPGRDGFSQKQAVELVCRQKELNFQTGDEYLYGNSNYLLLTEIIQRVSGKSLAELLKAVSLSPTA